MKNSSPRGVLKRERAKKHLLTLMRLNYMIVVDLLWFIEKSSSSSWHDPVDNLPARFFFQAQHYFSFSSKIFILRCIFMIRHKKNVERSFAQCSLSLYILLLSLAWLLVSVLDVFFSLPPKKEIRLRKKSK